MIMPQNAAVSCSVWTDVCHCIWFRVKTLRSKPANTMHFKIHTFNYSQPEKLHVIKLLTTQTLTNPEAFTPYVQKKVLSQEKCFFFHPKQ